MKNLQPNLKKMDEILFAQPIISAAQEHGCAARAMITQIAFAAPFGSRPPFSEGWLVGGARPRTCALDVAIWGGEVHKRVQITSAKEVGLQ